MTNLKNPNEVVIQAPEIFIIFSYPFNKINKVRVCSETGFTRLMIGLTVSKIYQKMYHEEKKTATLKEETIAERTKGAWTLMNRAETDGVWGIWGHEIGDLDLASVYSEDGINWDLNVDS